MTAIYAIVESQFFERKHKNEKDHLGAPHHRGRTCRGSTGIGYNKVRRTHHGRKHRLHTEGIHVHGRT